MGKISREKPLTVLTVGLGADDAYWLSRIDRPERFRFTPIGNFEQADNPERCRPRAFVSAALARLCRMSDRPAGIVGFDDYPASLLALAIANEAGLPGPRLGSALLCSHKAWSRLIQRRIVPDSVPRFQIIDPWRRTRPGELSLAFPFWLKPVKSSMSYLGLRVSSFVELERACQQARCHLPRYVRAFDELVELSGVTPPRGGRGIKAGWLIAEELLGGRQCTLEGYMRHGRFHFMAIVDSIRLPNRVSFSRFDYPSQIAAGEQREMARIAERVVSRIGLDDCVFNIEFFLDRRRNSPMIIEINPRFSPQYADLYHKVDGVLSHQYVVELAAGLEPSVRRREGLYNCAASCVLRVSSDRIVRKAPSKRQLAKLQKIMPGAYVYLTANKGDRLSDLVQDSFTFRYGLIHLGAANRKDLRDRLTRAKRMLTYELATAQDRARGLSPGKERRSIPKSRTR